MPQQLHDLPNIGPTLEKALRQAGIDSPEALRKLGSREAFLRIYALDPTACQSKLCALEGAIRAVRWHDLPADVHAQLADFYKSVKRKPAS
nr:TfoX/Sxy family protein [Maliibacterium massiliense]